MSLRAARPFGCAGRVLHVADSWDHDVAAALASYLASTEHLDHWVMADSGLECRIEDFSVHSRPAGVLPLPDGHCARVRAVADAYKSLQPDRVHAHSSGAGSYVRINPAIPTKSIVYTPHCYAFDRRDISSASRVLHALAEYILAPRASTVAASSWREAQLAARLHRTHRIVHVPHAGPPTPIEPLTPAPAVAASPLTAVAIGRLCPQEDPLFFAHAAAAASTSLKWVWIGDGDRRYRRILLDAGVHVTGPLPSWQEAALLRSAAVCVHTAAGEGNMRTLLQAADLGLPVAARRIPALEAIHLPDLVTSPQELASTALRLAVPGPDRTSHRIRLAHALQQHAWAAQSSRLREAYNLGSYPCAKAAAALPSLVKADPVRSPSKPRCQLILQRDGR